MVEQRCCLTLLVLSCLLLTLAEAGTVCPSGWSAFGSGCYKLIDDLRSWTEAKALCRSYNGSHMVVSNDKVESAFILDRLLGGSSDRIWLGGTYKSGKWEMEDLSSFTPSSLSGLAGDCLTMTKTDTKRTTCTDFNKFVCELEAPFCQNNQYPFDSSCYEVVSNPATASDYCKQRGGDLVVISNSDESTFVDKVKASESSVNPVCEVPRGKKFQLFSPYLKFISILSPSLHDPYDKGFGGLQNKNGHVFSATLLPRDRDCENLIFY